MSNTLARSKEGGEGLLGGLTLASPLKNRCPAGEVKMGSASLSQCTLIADAYTLIVAGASFLSSSMFRYSRTRVVQKYFKSNLLLYLNFEK